MKTLNGIVARKKAIRFHAKLLLADLHDKRSAEVDNIGITNIGELGI